MEGESKEDGFVGELRRNTECYLSVADLTVGRDQIWLGESENHCIDRGVCGLVPGVLLVAVSVAGESCAAATDRQESECTGRCMVLCLY